MVTQSSVATVESNSVRSIAKKLAIVTTHPIQYQSAWYKAMASRLDSHVFFCHRATPKEQAAAGFGVEFDWDTESFEGYPHTFLRNAAYNPSVARFAGLDTPEITEIIRNGGYDAVLVNGWHYKSAWQAIRACWRSKTPVMVRGDSHLYTERSFLRKTAKEVIYRQFIPRFDACLAVGTWSREYYLYYGARAERIFTVPHVLDNEYFARQAGLMRLRRQELREQWKLPSDAVVFLFAGKFIDKKRPKDFIDAIRLAAKQAPAYGLMVGDGPLRQTCEEDVMTHRLPIRFAGFLNQSQVIEGYVAADCLVLPSAGETWGIVVNEAMACGLPAIVDDHVGSGPDLIVPGVTGDIFPMGNVKALANAMLKWADPSRCRAASEAIQHKIKDYSLERAADGVIEAMRAL